ncbi:MAG: cell division protein FtsA, partial [Chitinophagaceae bacterium]
TAVIPFGGNVITDDIKEGCSIIEKQAELLKVKFGSAWPGENKDNEIVSIPGLRGREPKEISLKNLSKIIHARVVEIIEQVFSEIKSYGHEDPRKKLIAGIVLTGGGSQLQHIKQLVEYITGMDTRIGYPNEHLAGNSSEEISSPLYATAVGLVMNSVANKTQSAAPIFVEPVAKPVFQPQRQQPVAPPQEVQSEVVVIDLPANELPPTIEKPQEKKEISSTEQKIRRSFFDKYVDKIKEFLDNAE